MTERQFQFAWCLLHISAAIVAFRLMVRSVREQGIKAKVKAGFAGLAAAMHLGSAGYHGVLCVD